MSNFVVMNWLAVKDCLCKSVLNIDELVKEIEREGTLMKAQNEAKLLAFREKRKRNSFEKFLTTKNVKNAKFRSSLQQLENNVVGSKRLNFTFDVITALKLPLGQYT
jgi:hypothetical protein